MKTKNSILWPGTAVLMTMFFILCVAAWAGAEAKTDHPELSEQEMLTACSDCHKEATPDIEKQWYNSIHGIAMVKCYQCHGTFETFKVTPDREDCATCHADQLAKCPQDKNCWDCHVPHLFQLKK